MVEQTKIRSVKEILVRVTAPRPIKLDFTEARKGVDNHRIDVELSSSFVFKLRELIESQVRRVVTGKKLLSSNSEEMSDFRDCYSDMMGVTLHRNKIDLTLGQIRILQFAVVKFVLQSTREEFEQYEVQLEESQAQQHQAGSRGLLATQEKITWFRKCKDEFLFRINRLILRQLQREENKMLRKLREQILGQELFEATNIMFNPLLYTRSPIEPLLLVEFYALWPKEGVGFSDLNAELESVLSTQLPELKVEPLKSSAELSSGQVEIYDELGGLFAAQSMLGPSENQKEIVSESFTWLEQPGNIRLLFDEKLLAKYVRLVREEFGLKAQWIFKSEIKQLMKVVRSLKKTIASNVDMKKMAAGYHLREKLSQSELDLVALGDAASIVADDNANKLLATIDESKEGAVALVDKLSQLAEEFEENFKETEQDVFLKILTDIFRFRFHLKYYRFAHRVFNRISVITDEESLQLAKAGGQLYRLLDSEEVKLVASEEPEIIHHTILKADVRGSTTVTQELIRQDLNPASYFSLRFFDPINERLETYGAVKVFIEGDAVILGTYEYENSPTQWYSVSRACGMAKEMLDIINSKNAHSAQTSLPQLEVGIGICYADEMPLFLFDDNRPIMISSAIGDADRMSSCSWKLRGSFDSGEFNVEVLEIGDAQTKGEKGQDYIRYNVNGIGMDDAAFGKLKSEIALTRVSVKVGEKNETVFVGKFPDIQGKERSLAIRQGVVGFWTGEEVVELPDSEGVFYEVLPNSKFASQLISLADKQAKTKELERG
ncbi:MAG: hypothetical protein VB957_10535 [Pseudomonadales bacterium]